MSPTLYRANLNYLLQHPWQLALAMLGISIGVAVIVAVDLANNSSKKAFLLSMDAVTGQATHQIIGGPRGIDESLYVSLRVEHGIRSTAPVVEGFVTVDESSLQVLGVDLFAEQEMRAFSGEVSSDAQETQSFFRDMLTRPGAVIMSNSTANALNLSAGDRFNVVAGGKRHSAILLGMYTNDAGAGLDNLMTADIATAQAWFDLPGKLSRIDVRIADGDSDLEDRLEALLPAFMTNLTAMSLLALLVGLFLIYNSVSFSILQRRHLIGVLRALGTTRRQVFALVFTETALIGFVASLLGVAAGIFLGGKLLGLVSQSINDFYFRVSVTEVSISTFSITKGIVAGMGAAMVAAAVPALEASSYRPRLAMTRSVLEQQTRRVLPFVALAGVAATVMAIVVLALSGRSLVAGLIAVFMLILGFALCVPYTVKAAAHVLSPLAKGLGGIWARLAVTGIGNSLSRTGVATLQADIYAGTPRGNFDPDLVEKMSSLPGVAAVSTNRRSWHENERGRTQLRATRMAPGSYAGTELLDADPAEVWRSLRALCLPQPGRSWRQYNPAHGERRYTVPCCRDLPEL
jgi:putative ABC transport system permease protein